MALRSLRTRFLVGSVLWTLGLLAVSHMVFVLILRWFPDIAGTGHWLVLGIVAVAFMLGGLSQVRRGLSPVNQLRARLLAVRDGQSRRVEGTYPTEVQPLVDDLNTLIEQREHAVVRAQSRAGDLAHGLKTPLALLTQEAERLSAHGEAPLADSMRQHVDRMRRQVEYHLAHARASASGARAGTVTPVVASAGPLARTLARLHDARIVSIDLAVPSDHAVRVEREDLDEMLGNLLDNACRCAHSRVVLTSEPAGDSLLLLVDDDGPGLALEMRDLVLQRGVRGDEAGSGSGLGLAIVRDLADVYGGAITLGDSPLGGLRATLRLPVVTSSIDDTDRRG
jgi:signal transduction histidine kinase